ncbi:uncharacterized protein A4U43_C08F29400 [Asparagus officinalis]|nr:uncharacterized protein A4U43_C08F29400 [Asparagus officinalis]
MGMGRDGGGGGAGLVVALGAVVVGVVVVLEGAALVAVVAGVEVVLEGGGTAGGSGFSHFTAASSKFDREETMTAQTQEELLAAHLEQQKIDVNLLSLSLTYSLDL